MKSKILPIAAMAAGMLVSVASAQEGPIRAEIVARLPQSVGNIAITPDNQIIFSHHPFFSPDVRVAKLTSSTTFQPFPNADWNTPRKGTDHYLDNVLGLRSDENGIVWIIDMGFRTKITLLLGALKSIRCSASAARSASARVRMAPFSMDARGMPSKWSPSRKSKLRWASRC